MPATTPNQGYPYPLDSDLQDTANDIKNLALSVDEDIDSTIALVDAKVSVAGDTMTGMLTLPGTNPTSLNHAVRKGWADTTYLNKTGDAMSGDLDMNNHNVTNLGAPAGDGYATRKSYVDNVFADAVKKTTTGTQTIEGSLRAEYFLISGADSPNGPYQATPKWYVDQEIAASGLTQDEADTRYINKNGDTMEGTLLSPTSPFILGGDWQSLEAALRLNPEGVIRSTVINSGQGPSITLNREGSANAADQYYMQFNFSVDQPHGSIQIQTDGAGVNYNTSSDGRLKERLGPITDAAARVQQLAERAFTGRWIGGQRSRDMLTAQDIGEVAPYAVSGGSDVQSDPMMVSYGELVPMLVAALGAALDRIDRLEAGLA